MPIDYTTLFSRVRAINAVIDGSVAYAGTDLPADLAAVMTAWSAAVTDPDQYDQIASLLRAAQSVQSQSTLRSAAFTLLGAEILRQVQAVYPEVRSQVEARNILFWDMIDDSETVKENVVSVTPTTPAGRDQLMATIEDAYRRKIQVVFNETVTGEVKTDGSAVFKTATAKNKNDYDWPGASGMNHTIRNNTSSLVSGGFDLYDATAGDGYPSDWAVHVGTIGTTLATTTYESQTVTIAGTPTAGFYTLSLTDFDGRIQTTEPLVFDATASSVQSAINALVGWENVTVSSTGTSPNYQHTLFFDTVPNAISAVTYFSGLDTGTITIGAGGAVDAKAVSQKALKIIGNGAQLTRLATEIALRPLTVYAFGVRLRKSASATGVIRFRLLNPDNTVMQDYGLNNNDLSVNLTAVTSGAFSAHTTFWRSPQEVPAGSKLEMALTTAINASEILYVDEMMIWEAGVLRNGVIVARYPVDQPLITEEYTLAMTNNYAGKIQTLWMRAFGQQLPSATSGAETVTDT